jgi:hypothetical protein
MKPRIVVPSLVPKKTIGTKDPRWRAHCANLHFMTTLQKTLQCELQYVHKNQGEHLWVIVNFGQFFQKKLQK